MKDSSIYTVKLHKPLTEKGQEYTELTFDFESLTGADSRAVDAELAARGVVVAFPTYSAEYQICIAVRACQQKIGRDAYDRLSLKDYNRIKGIVRDFLQGSEP